MVSHLVKLTCLKGPVGFSTITPKAIFIPIRPSMKSKTVEQSVLQVSIQKIFCGPKAGEFSTEVQKRQKTILDKILQKKKTGVKVQREDVELF